MSSFIRWVEEEEEEDGDDEDEEYQKIDERKTLEVLVWLSIVVISVYRT